MTVGITELPPEGMQLGGVALAGDAERGTKTTEGLSLLFTTAGITVQGPQPQIERLLVWSGLDSANCREKVALPDGRNAAVMELTSGGQAIRFLLPLDTVTPGQAAYLDQALPAWLARYKGGTASATQPPPPAPAVGHRSEHARTGASVGVAGSAASPPAPTVAPPDHRRIRLPRPACHQRVGRRVGHRAPPPPSPTAPPAPGSFDAPAPSTPGVPTPRRTGGRPGSTVRHRSSPGPFPGSAGSVGAGATDGPGIDHPPLRHHPLRRRPPRPPPATCRRDRRLGRLLPRSAPTGPDGRPRIRGRGRRRRGPGQEDAGVAQVQGRSRRIAAAATAAAAIAPSWLPSDPRPEPPRIPRPTRSR